MRACVFSLTCSLTFTNISPDFSMPQTWAQTASPHHNHFLNSSPLLPPPRSCSLSPFTFLGQNPFTLQRLPCQEPMCKTSASIPNNKWRSPCHHYRCPSLEWQTLLPTQHGEFYSTCALIHWEPSPSQTHPYSPNSALKTSLALANKAMHNHVPGLP